MVSEWVGQAQLSVCLSDSADPGGQLWEVFLFDHQPHASDVLSALKVTGS